MVRNVEKVRAILGAHDIEGLIQTGAPVDEYEMEAQRIVDEISQLPDSATSEDAIFDIVISVWQKAFGVLGQQDLVLRMPAFRQVAKAIVEA